MEFIEKMAEKAMGQGQQNQGGPPGGYPRPQEGYMGQPGYGEPQMQGYGPPQGGFMGQGQPGYGGEPRMQGGYGGGPMEGYGMGGPGGGGFPGGYGGGGGGPGMMGGGGGPGMMGGGGGYGGGYGGEHEGLDWSHLGRLAQHYDQQPVPGDGGPPPPSDANPNIINKLLGHFQQNTGSSFSGQGDQFDQLAGMASRLTGFPIPASMLRKLVGAKLNGML